MGKFLARVLPIIVLIGIGVYRYTKTQQKKAERRRQQTEQRMLRMRRNRIERFNAAQQRALSSTACTVEGCDCKEMHLYGISMDTGEKVCSCGHEEALHRNSAATRQ